MKPNILSSALALVAALVPVAVSADDPNDPAMRTAQARARDRAIIRQLNIDQLAKVRARDARYAEGWRAYAAQHDDRAAAKHSDAEQEYARERSRYDREMAAWRRAVTACNHGHYEYCQR